MDARETLPGLINKGRLLNIIYFCSECDHTNHLKTVYISDIERYVSVCLFFCEQAVINSFKLAECDRIERPDQ